MAWTAPKEDWGATDAVPHTELNKIGENLRYLSENINLSGAYMKELALSTGANAAQAILVTIPDDHTLTLVHWRYYFEHVNLQLEVEAEIDGGASQHIETGTLSKEDVVKNQLMYTNTSGSPVDIKLTVSVYKNTAAQINEIGGWWVHLNIDDV